MTDENAPIGRDLPPPLPPPPPAAPAVAPVPRQSSPRWWARRLWKLPVWAWLIIVVLALGALTNAGKKKEQAASSTTVVPAATSAPTSTSSSVSAATSQVAASSVTSAAPTPTTPVTTTEAVTTTTVAPTTTQPPTTTTLAPQTFAGVGADVIDLGVGNQRIFLVATHNGTSNFIVTALDQDLQRLGGVINEIGNYAGTRLINANSADIRFIQVEADGNWTIDLIDATALPESPDTMMGQGDAVWLYSGQGGIFAATHDGESNFVVQVITSDSTDIAINEIGTFTGRIPVSAGLAFVVVQADGTWTLVPA